MTAKSDPFEPHDFDAELDRLVQKTFFHEPTPDVLYHYTKWDSAEGILNSKQIWATSHDCTNDPAELSSAGDVIVTVARDIRNKFAPPGRQILDCLADNYSKSKITKITPVFLSCFSAARDKDILWQKSYGDQGRGLCLGIKVLRNELPPNDGLGRAILRVDYSEVSWRKRVTSGFSQVCSRLNEVTVKDPNMLMEVRDLALNALYRIAAVAEVTAKTSKWAHEEEWRLVFFPKRGVSITPLERYVDDKCIKYISVNVRPDKRPLAIDEILMGPKQSEGEALLQQLEDLLKRAGYPHEFAQLPKITTSKALLEST